MVAYEDEVNVSFPGLSGSFRQGKAIKNCALLIVSVVDRLVLFRNSNKSQASHTLNECGEEKKKKIVKAIEGSFVERNWVNRDLAN